MAGPITLDELIALNDEILALVRAGVPLEQGLADVGHDVRGSLGRISSMLSERMQRGESLPQALSASQEQFPPLYRAIVEAGIRSGRLAAALEEMSGSVRRLAALRRLVVLAMVYPLLVFFICYGLFLYFALKVAPTLLSAAPMPHPPAIVRAISHVRDGIEWWGPILPTIVLTAAILWFYRSRRALVLEAGGAARFFAWVPSFRRLLLESRTAGFADTLALLVDHQVPLTEAVVLSAKCSGDARLILAAKQLAADVADGIVAGAGAPSGADRGANPIDIPPLLRWLIATGGNQPALGKSLREAADTYRRRAVRRADWLRLYFPMLVTLGIGGTVTALYALSLFIPWTTMLYDLSKP
ncbi:MAG TPA: type II secretion system F family protein [Pirellulales bacterium]|nr:type II secretion system F family protein [Pirellulales bacterium]